MSTTPTPNERDWQLANLLWNELSSQDELANAIASYRAEIESKYEALPVVIKIGEQGLEIKALKERISTLEKALSKAKTFILQKPCPERCIRDGECNCGKWRTISAIRQAKGQA